MNDWIDVSFAKPEQMGQPGGEFSELVDVLLNNGEQDEDFLINGKWVMYCTKNTAMPQIVAWRPKEQNCEGGKDAAV